MTVFQKTSGRYDFGQWTVKADAHDPSQSLPVGIEVTHETVVPFSYIPATSLIGDRPAR
jgi:hypothetical protein